MLCGAEKKLRESVAIGARVGYMSGSSVHHHFNLENSIITNWLQIPGPPII